MDSSTIFHDSFHSKPAKHTVILLQDRNVGGLMLLWQAWWNTCQESAIQHWSRYLTRQWLRFRKSWTYHKKVWVEINECTFDLWTVGNDNCQRFQEKPEEGERTIHSVVYPPNMPLGQYPANKLQKSQRQKLHMKIETGAIVNIMGEDTYKNWNSTTTSINLYIVNSKESLPTISTFSV